MYSKVDNVVWCTGFDPGFLWVDLPIFDGGRVMHDRGIVASQPGLFFVGLKYLYRAVVIEPQWGWP